jgi:hypothetical protein
VNPISDPLLIRNSGSARNRTWTSGSDQTTEVVKMTASSIFKVVYSEDTCSRFPLNLWYLSSKPILYHILEDHNICGNTVSVHYASSMHLLVWPHLEEGCSLVLFTPFNCSASGTFGLLSVVIVWISLAWLYIGESWSTENFTLMKQIFKQYLFSISFYLYACGPSIHEGICNMCCDKIQVLKFRGFQLFTALKTKMQNLCYHGILSELFQWLRLALSEGSNGVGIFLPSPEEGNRPRRMVSSGMLHCLALVRTDILEELSTSFIRVTRISELGTMLAVTSNRHTLRRNSIIHTYIHTYIHGTTSQLASVAS